MRRSGLTGRQIQKLAESYASKLGEHCDSVVILCTFHSSANQHLKTNPEGDATSVSTRAGSYYASRSMMECFLRYPGTFWLRMSDRWRRLTFRRQTAEVVLGNVHAARGGAATYLEGCIAITTEAAPSDHGYDCDDDDDGEAV